MIVLLGYGKTAIMSKNFIYPIGSFVPLPQQSRGQGKARAHLAEVKSFVGKNFKTRKIVSIAAKNRWGYICETFCEACNKICLIPFRFLRINNSACRCQCKEIISRANTTHGMSKKAEFRAWRGIISRTSPNYFTKNYTDRGISLDKEWFSFENFYRDMGPKPSPIHSVDRIDNNKGYSKGNCRWATPTQQAANTRKSVRFAHNGKTYSCRDVASMIERSMGTVLWARKKHKTLPELLIAYERGDLLKDL